jgi:hypothetical protein
MFVCLFIYLFMSDTPREGLDFLVTTTAQAKEWCSTAEATRPKEIEALLKFGRDSAWPLKIVAAAALDEQISLSIT